jgi:hypothetical protein
MPIAIKVEVEDSGKHYRYLQQSQGKNAAESL